MQNDKKIMHAHIPFSETEIKLFRNYCSENGIIMGQLIRRLILKEINDKSLSNLNLPKTSECFKKGCR